MRSSPAPTARPVASSPRWTTTARPAPARAARSANTVHALVTGVSTNTAPASRRGFGAYGATVSGLGALLLCALAVTGDPLPLGDWRFWLMGALVLVGELMPIDVPRRDGADRVAISTAFAFALMLEFGLLPAVLAYAAASVIADAHARLALVKVTFNAAQYGLSLAASALVLAALGHEAPIGSIAGALP